MLHIIGYIFSLFIGLALGMVGGGGTLLSIPILKYLFDIHDNQLLTSYSLFIVGITSFFGVVRNAQMGNIHWKTALSFAIPSVISLLAVRYWILPATPDILLQTELGTLYKDLFFICVFAVLMIVVAVSMLRKNDTTTPKTPITPNLPKMIIMGFVVGFMTGFLGAGGGFVIIPALYFFAGLNMKEALGTSLLIITINTLIGFAGDVVRGISFDYFLLTKITILAIGGMWIGTIWAKKINADKLKPIFGWFVLLMGIYILIKELF